MANIPAKPLARAFDLSRRYFELEDAMHRQTTTRGTITEACSETTYQEYIGQLHPV
jgi:hypothetical protein